MNSLRFPNWPCLIITVVGAVIFAYTLAALTRGILSPAIDSNATAYLELSTASRSGLYSEIEKSATSAYKRSSDPEIRKLAGMLQRYSRMAQDAGVTTTEEAGSFSGFTKAFLAGFANPLLSVRSLGITLDLLFTDYEKIGNQLDAKYLPIYSRFFSAERTARFVFWGALITASIIYALQARTIDGILAKQLKRISQPRGS